MAGKAIDVTTASYDAEVARAAVPVVVDLWATWCGPCKAISPALEEIAGEAGGAFKVVKVDIDASPELAQRLGVQSVPTLVVVRGGEVVAKAVGAKPKGAMRRWIDESIRA